MTIGNRFNRGAQAPQTSNAPAGGSASRYAGIEPTGGTGTPDPGPGDYVLEVTSAGYDRSKKTQKEFFEAIFVVVDSDGEQASPPGASVRFGSDVNIVGVKIIRDFVMAANGYDDLDAFNAWAAVTPDATVEDVAGKRVAARCSAGKPNGKGGYYTEWQFAPAD